MPILGCTPANSFHHVSILGYTPANPFHPLSQYWDAVRLTHSICHLILGYILANPLHQLFQYLDTLWLTYSISFPNIRIYSSYPMGSTNLILGYTPAN